MMPDILPLLTFLAHPAAIVLMSIFLARSMKKTIYSYTNISLIGGILFTAVLTVLNARLYLNHPADPLEFAGRLLAFPRTFSYYAFFVISLICILLGISNISLIRHEGFCLNNALSLLVAGLYLGGTALVYLIADHLVKDVFVPLGLQDQPIFVVLGTFIPLFCLMMLCYFECILAGTGILGYLAARTVPDHDRDYIVILGCTIDKRGGLLPLLKGRVNRAVRFAWEQEIDTGKPLKYIPSGGQGPNEIMSEGSAMAFYLMTHGAEEDEVFPEKESRNTLENFRCSRKIMEAMTPNPKVAFATTNYHILRSGILARKAGIDAQGIAGDTKWYFWPNGFVREFFGILVLERRTHVIAALFLALLCLAAGIAEYALIV